MPSLAGYLTFIRSQNITANDLPDNSPSIPDTYQASLEVVNRSLQQVSTFFYDKAVYNLGVSFLINYAPDNGNSTFFSKARKEWHINDFAAGVVQSGSDVSTAHSLLVSDFAQKFTLADLQHLKDPWGRAYSQIAQRYGSLVGLT